MYTRNEQCRRLLASVLNVPSVNLEVPLEDQMRSTYEDHIAPFLQDHPFLQGVDKFANSVFQSYLFALALKGTLGEHLQERVTTELLKPDLLPTRLLGEFYLRSCHDFSDSQMTIAPEHLGILYDSLASSESSANHVRLNVDGINPIDLDPGETVEPEEAEGEFEFWSVSDGETHLVEERPFTMAAGTGSIIRFTRHLRDAFITVPCSVELGSGTNEFQIGPSVQITASVIRVSADNLIVGGNTNLKPNEEGADEVILEATDGDSGSSCSRVTLYTGTDLSVTWPGSERYPWNEYRSQSQAEDLGNDETLHRAYMRFKRIATAFRSHSKGSLARKLAGNPG